MDQPSWHLSLIVLAALVTASTARPSDCAGQAHSNVATVSLTATVPAGATLRPTEPMAETWDPQAPPRFSLSVNSAYRLQIRWLSNAELPSPQPKPLWLRASDRREREFSPGSTVTLLPHGGPGPVPLDGVWRSLDDAGIDARALPLTVEVVVTPTL